MRMSTSVGAVKVRVTGLGLHLGHRHPCVEQVAYIKISVVRVIGPC